MQLACQIIHSALTLRLCCLSISLVYCTDVGPGQITSDLGPNYKPDLSFLLRFQLTVLHIVFPLIRFLQQLTIVIGDEQFFFF